MPGVRLRPPDTVSTLPRRSVQAVRERGDVMANGDSSSTGPSTTRVEQFNQLVRAFCVVALITTLCVAFLWGIWRDDPVVSIEAFIGVLTFAMTWWFKARDDQQRRTDLLPPTTTTTATTTAGAPGEPAKATVTTTPTPPTGG